MDNILDKLDPHDTRRAGQTQTIVARALRIDSTSFLHRGAFSPA
jgi:hypothetical protein